MSWQTDNRGVNRWITEAAALAAEAPAVPAPPKAAPAAPGDRWLPIYGPFRSTGTAVHVRIGRELFQLPQGCQIAPLDETVLVVLDPGDRLFMLTASGSVTNLSKAAASALGRRLFDCPEAVPG